MINFYELRPSSSFGLFVNTLLPLQQPHQYAPKTIRVATTIPATVVAIDDPNITTTARTAVITATTAALVGTDDELGLIPSMYNDIKTCYTLRYSVIKGKNKDLE